MQRIDFSNTARNIECKAFAIVKQQQEMAKKPNWLATIYRLINREGHQQIALGRECQKLLACVERVPVIFSADPVQTLQQKNYHTACIKAAKLVIFAMSSSKLTSIRDQMARLMSRVSALQYRMEAVNGGLDPAEIDSALTIKLCEKALNWKDSHPLIIKKELTAEEVRKLEEASTYPDFARSIISSKSLSNCFFNWALQNNNEVRQFVEFPATCNRLKSSFLASRVGKLADTFRICKEEKERFSEKVVTLPFYTQNKTEHISILDGSRKVDLDDRNNGVKTYTINQIFEVFIRKNNEIGDLEMFKDGIRYWNCHQLGGIDLTVERWWEQLPIIEEITAEQMEKRIDDSLSENEWIVFAKSSRTTADMDLDKRHGYLEVAIPTSEGTYRVYPFGIFPHAFPNSIPELVSFLGKTNPAKISYPDENFFYSHRQQASHPIKLTNDEAKTVMRTLQKELIRSRFGRLIFQFGAENCAYWAQNIINSVETKKYNFFKLDFVKSYPLNPILKSIFNLIRNLPTFCREIVIKAVDRCFWSSRGLWIAEKGTKIFKSHHTSHVRNECVIYQPGYLHQQIEEGKIKGRINLGNC